MEVTVGYGNYDLRPRTTLGGHRAWSGAQVWGHLARAAQDGERQPFLVMDCYPGVDTAALTDALGSQLPGWEVVDVEAEAASPIDEIDRLIARNLTDDRVFGVLSHHTLDEFYDAGRLAALAGRIAARRGPVVAVGWGAALVPEEPTCLVLADLPRWEIQQRQRAGAPNWRCENQDEDTLRKVKRGYFVEWRVADRHKRRLFDRIDFVLDTTDGVPDARMISAETFQAALDQTVSGPFRVVPYFDPGTWGGQWMRKVCGLPEDAPNYAWCFDCVPEENSWLVEVDGVEVELPSIDLVFERPKELLGIRTHARYGPEFPIRFDLLDTMGGGNLSLQVHPLTGYIQDVFGMHYTQDESYYLLDADDGAVVYLGLKEGVDAEEMLGALRTAEDTGEPFAAERFVNTFPARKHDHFSIPAGTLHCSGTDSMVLEVSSTPYLFTFKMWDWGRVGMDGKPRPINVEHASRSIQWDRDTGWVEANLVGGPQPTGSGDGWREERTGLHELEPIETRRRWLRAATLDDTRGTVHVINLVAGRQAVLSSPTDEFEPFTLHYAETCIVPAQVGSYLVTPPEGEEVATLTAWVRGTETRA